MMGIYRQPFEVVSDAKTGKKELNECNFSKRRCFERSPIWYRYGQTVAPSKRGLSWCSWLSRSPHTRKVSSSNLDESILLVA
jgi:hypothetical protein